MSDAEKLRDLLIQFWARTASLMERKPDARIPMKLWDDAGQATGMDAAVDRRFFALLGKFPETAEEEVRLVQDPDNFPLWIQALNGVIVEVLGPQGEAFRRSRRRLTGLPARRPEPAD